MCRIMSLTNVSKIKDLDATMLQLRDLVSKHNNDGFGYSVSYKSNLFTEKFIKPSDFVGLNKTLLHDKMALPIFDNSNSLSHGEHGEKPLAIIAHGRTSTNLKGDVNYSHPFVKHDNAFIHNGVIDVPRKHDFDLITENDSEYLANVFWKHGHSGLNRVSGYFAFMNLKLNGKMEIAKDNIASLYAAYIPALDSYVFATLENMIVEFCNNMQLQSTRISPVTSMQYFVVQGSKISASTSITKSVKVKQLTASEKKAFKDYSKPTKGFNEYRATKVLGNESMPAKFSDPHYWETDAELNDRMDFETKWEIK